MSKEATTAFDRTFHMAIPLGWAEDAAPSNLICPSRPLLEARVFHLGPFLFFCPSHSQRGRPTSQRLTRSQR